MPTCGEVAVSGGIGENRRRRIAVERLNCHQRHPITSGCWNGRVVRVWDVRGCELLWVSAGQSALIEDLLGRGEVLALQFSCLGKVGRVRREVGDRAGVVLVDGR